MYPHLCASIAIRTVTKRQAPHIDSAKYYPADETARFLTEGKVTTTATTVKNYCRRGKELKCKQFGPKKIWHALGSSIIALRRKWGFDA